MAGEKIRVLIVVSCKLCVFNPKFLEGSLTEDLKISLAILDYTRVLIFLIIFSFLSSARYTKKKIQKLFLNDEDNK